MSAEEDLIDYSDEELQTNEAAATQPAIAATNGTVNAGDMKVSGGKGHVGLNTAGFRDFLLKPELSRAITDCGFEHPSEGQS